MRKCFTVAILLLLAASALLLSACDDSEYDQETVFNNITAQMKLGDEQADLLRPIFIGQIAKARSILEAAKNKMSGERPDFQRERPSFQPGNPLVAELATVTKEAEEKLVLILSAQQIEEYNALLKKELDKIMESSRPTNGPGRGGPPGGGMPGGMPGGQRPNW